MIRIDKARKTDFYKNSDPQIVMCWRRHKMNVVVCSCFSRNDQLRQGLYFKAFLRFLAPWLSGFVRYCNPTFRINRMLLCPMTLRELCAAYRRLHTDRRLATPAHSRYDVIYLSLSRRRTVFAKTGLLFHCVIACMRYGYELIGAESQNLCILICFCAD